MEGWKIMQKLTCPECGKIGYSSWEENATCEECKGKFHEDEKHIIKEGSRYHVLSWDSNGRHCSNPKCEVNSCYAKEETV